MKGFLSVEPLLALHRLLSDTEVRENVVEDVLRVDFAGNRAEVVQRLAHITCHQVAGDAVLQTSSCF